MKRLHIFLFTLLALTGFLFQTTTIYAQTALGSSLTLEERLAQLPGVEFTRMDIDTTFFKEGFEIMFTQPIDHEHPERGTFKQKLYLKHLDFSRPMVIELDGYNVPRSGRSHELTKYLDANYILVEHRYFGQSVPDSMIWECLSIKQSADDHHAIIEMFKKLYSSKWISTGISKGGQTASYHRRYYPDDVDVTVPYVAPLNLAVNDQRIYDFLDNVGTDECRKQLRDFQRAILEKRKKIYPMFVERNKSKGYIFNQDMEKIFELSVLEFEFSYWQWGDKCDKMPDLKSKPSELFRFFEGYDPESFFEKSNVATIFPFFYQAYTEVGLYGYRIDYYKDLLTQFTTDVDNFETFVPKEFNIKYDPSTLQDIVSWLKENGKNMIFIYGEKDAWSSTAFEPGDNINILKIVKKDGSHTTRILNLPGDQKKLVLSTLEKWLDMEIDE